VTSSWFFLSTPNYDARSTTHQIFKMGFISTHIPRPFKAHWFIYAEQVYHSKFYILPIRFIGVYASEQKDIFPHYCINLLECILLMQFVYHEVRTKQLNIIWFDFVVLLTVHLSILMQELNNFMHKIFVFQKVYFMSLHVSSTCAHNQEVKIALHSV
jgi:hypothetical protein